MPRYAVKENWLEARIGEQVGCLDHLVERCSRPAHRHKQPVHTCVGNHFRLADVLRVIAVDRCQRHDRLDPLTAEDRAQCGWRLPVRRG